MNPPHTDTARVYFVQHDRTFPVTLNDVTRPILAHTLFIEETKQYFIDRGESPADYAALEAHIVSQKRR